MIEIKIKHFVFVLNEYIFSLNNNGKICQSSTLLKETENNICFWIKIYSSVALGLIAYRRPRKLRKGFQKKDELFTFCG